MKESALKMLKRRNSRLFTTKPELERSGMGFTIMENFMDEISIESAPKRGTTVRLKKALIKK